MKWATLREKVSYPRVIKGRLAEIEPKINAAFPLATSGTVHALVIFTATALLDF